MMKFLIAPSALLFTLISASPIAAKPATSRDLRKHSVPITALAYAPDGKTLASADASGRVILTDVSSGKTKLSFRYKQTVAALAYSPDGKLLAVARAKEVRLLNPTTAKAIRVLTIQQEVGGALGFSASGARLIVTEGDGRDGAACSVWDVATGRRLRRHVAKTAESNCATLSPSGEVFVAPDTSKFVLGVSLWSVATGKRILPLADDTTEEESPFINTAAFSPDGKYVAGLGFYFEAAGHLTLWDVATGEVRWGKTFRDTGNAVAWASNSSKVTIGTQYETPYDDPKHLHKPTGAPVFDAAKGTWLFSVQRTPSEIAAIAWSPDGKTLATGGDDKTVRLWGVLK